MANSKLYTRFNEAIHISFSCMFSISDSRCCFMKTYKNLSVFNVQQNVLACSPQY